MINEYDYDNFQIRGVWLQTGEMFSMNYPNYPIFPTDEPLIIGIDPSTTQTGIAVKTLSGIPVALVDIINHGIIDKDTLHLMMEHFFEDSLTNAKVHTFILEEPFLSNNDHTYRVLKRLKTYLKNLTRTLPALADANFGELKPSSWRSTFLADIKYKGRKQRRNDAKQAAMEETMDRLPSSHDYINSFKNPPDSCDAYGILEGYLAKVNHRGEANLEVVNSTMKKNHRIEKTFFVACATTDTLAQVVKDVINNPTFISERGIKTLQYETNMTIEDNVGRAVSENEEIHVLYLPESEQDIVFMWEYGFKVRRNLGEFYVVICYRDKVSQKTRAEIKTEQTNFWTTRSYFS